MNTGKILGCTLALTVLVLGSQKLNAQDNGLLLDCECPLVRMDNAYCAATWVFEGIPLSADTIFSTSTGVDARDQPIARVDILFDVQRWLKGTVRKKVVIAASLERDECAFLFDLGTRYLVFANNDQEFMVADRCTLTRALETISAGFVDSLEYVGSGHQWEGYVPLDKPCN